MRHQPQPVGKQEEAGPNAFEMLPTCILHRCNTTWLLGHRDDPKDRDVEGGYMRLGLESARVNHKLPEQ